MAQCQDPRAQIIRLFLAFTYIWLKEFAKISKVPEALSYVNLARSGQ